MKSSVLIVGGNGFLGSCLAMSLCHRFERIDGIGRSSEYPPCYSNWFNSDMNSHDLSIDLGVYNYIVNCAGSGSVGLVKNNPGSGFLDTVKSLQNLLKLYVSSNSSAKIIYCSSAAVYGQSQLLPTRVDSKLRPISSYGRYKQIAEIILEDFCRIHEVPFSIIRFFSIYGPLLKKQLLWDASNKLTDTNCSSSTFFGTGNETRDWIYIRDAVSLINFMFSCNLEVVNGASGISVRNSEVIHLLHSSLNSNHKFIFNNIVRQDDPFHYQADIDDLLCLGWTPQISIQEGITKYSTWFRSLKK
jgi:UDP-glucose 4-epimerase